MIKFLSVKLNITLIFSLLIILGFFLPSISFAETSSPIKILLVPGHDNEARGAQYGNLKESVMNLAVGTRIFNILKKDKRFEVHITRDQDGYTKEFADYFANNRAEVTAFEEAAKAEMQNKIKNGSFIQKENVPHQTASEDVAIRLYGFNKWADENKIDAMIHIHFNDYSRPHPWTAGKYKGFVIYMPDGQLVNWKESGQLAAHIFTQLHKKYSTSTYEKERGGLIPDQKLIGLGANGTLDASVRSILIEYGYIYSLGKSSARQSAYDNMASLTATGIKNYFFLK